MIHFIPSAVFLYLFSCIFLSPYLEWGHLESRDGVLGFFLWLYYPDVVVRCIGMCQRLPKYPFLTYLLVTSLGGVSK